MPNLIIVNNPADWTFDIPGVECVSAREYLSRSNYSRMRNVRIFNLCKSYRYQSIGYYVSLLAAARGHKPLPNISTIQDLKSQSLIRLADSDLDEIIQRSLSPLQSSAFILSIYFGRNTARCYDRLALHLYNLFPAPLLRANFVRIKNVWHLRDINPVSGGDIPPEHCAFLTEVAADHFSGRRIGTLRRRRKPLYDMAILRDQAEKEAPSNEKAIKKFVIAAEALGFSCDLIGRDDFGRLAEYDALFIRETTGVNHHTYRFARKAAAEGLVVIDDPESILKCTNKVYLAELLKHHGIKVPYTQLVHRDNLETGIKQIGVPCVLKQPDSAFSHGVVRIDTEQDFKREADRLLLKSELIVVQEFLPTDFDWRVGIINGYPLFVCKYHMVHNHWQIIKWDDSGHKTEGHIDVLPVEHAPRQVVRTALKAANLIGNGLYGVDIKQLGSSYYVIEINDNPNIDSGTEDRISRMGLYEKIMGVFLERILARKTG